MLSAPVRQHRAGPSVLASRQPWSISGQSENTAGGWGAVPALGPCGHAAQEQGVWGQALAPSDRPGRAASLAAGQVPGELLEGRPGGEVGGCPGSGGQGGGGAYCLLAGRKAVLLSAGGTGGRFPGKVVSSSSLIFFF